jgi:hypothetical protein
MCMQGSRTHGAHTSWFDCVHGGRPSTHPHILHAACTYRGVLYRVEWHNSAYVSPAGRKLRSARAWYHPRLCRLDGVGLQLDADHVPLQPVQVRLPQQRARLLAKLIAGTHEARRHSREDVFDAATGSPSGKGGRRPVSGRSVQVVTAPKHEHCR